jgi:hypothetical protein
MNNQAKAKAAVAWFENYIQNLVTSPIEQDSPMANILDLLRPIATGECVIVPVEPMVFLSERGYAMEIKMILNEKEIDEIEQGTYKHIGIYAREARVIIASHRAQAKLIAEQAAKIETLTHYFNNSDSQKF